MRGTLQCVGIALLIAGTSPSARGEPSVQRLHDDDLALSARGGFVSASPMPLRLSWPVAPLRFSFSEVRPLVPALWNGPTELFATRSVWFEEDKLGFSTFSEAQQATELDCRLTCKAVKEVVAGAELKLGLGKVGDRVPDTWAFGRFTTLITSSAATAPARAARNGRLEVGLGGLLDF